MKRNALAIALGLACARCGLFPDVATLESDASNGADANVNDASVNDANNTLDGDASATPPDASWAYESTMGNYVTGTVTNVSVKAMANAGDLVIVACDTESNAGALTLDAVTAKVAPNVIGPIENQANSLETQIFWGVAETTGAIDMMATTSASTGFLDCSVEVYRGGTKNAALVTKVETEGAGVGNTSCGPITTVAGGVAFYVAVRYTCAGAPSAPFTQRQDLEGNPAGDVAPTNGTSVMTTLAACNPTAGDAWVCLMVSISP